MFPRSTSQLRLDALSGRFSDELIISADTWKVPHWKLLVFLSSTFTDTHIERDILMKEILPYLRDRVNMKDIDVTFVDMRWGVLDENTCNHQTWIACQRELTRCWKESRGLFFLSLQSQKYGYTPLPRMIDLSFVDDNFFSGLSSAHQALFKEWYVIDENACPPVYVLGDLKDVNDLAFWNGPFKQLLPALDGIPFDSQLPELLINRSVTEYEVRAASRFDPCVEILRSTESPPSSPSTTSPPPPPPSSSSSLPSSSKSMSKMVWFHRRFNGGVTKDGEHWLYDDTLDDEAKHLNFSNMISWMKTSIDATDTFDYESATYSDYTTNTAVWQQQSTRFADDVRGVLERAVDNVVAERKQWDADGCGVGMEGPFLTEMLHHAAWAATKLKDFLGRESLVCSICEAIMADAEAAGGASSQPPFEGLSLALVGGSGCGKTSLMAKVAQEVFKLQQLSSNATLKDRPIVVRFCGTSADSATGIALVESVCHQLHFVLRNLGPSPGPDLVPPDFATMNYEQTVAHLHLLLREHAVLLLVDSLDQLSDRDLARSELSFLKGAKLHPFSRIIVSTLPDERKNGVTRYWYGCDSLLLRHDVPRITITAAAAVEEEEESETAVVDEACSMLKQLLQRRKRRLAEHQWALVRQQTALEPTPLYVQLTLRVVASWPSTFTPSSSGDDLPAGVRPLINYIMNMVEAQFGRTLVRAALGFVALSVRGVTDREMCDLLSVHPGVMTSVNAYNQAESLPPHVWLRLRGEIDGLISEGEEGCLTWYHRQLQETVEERFGADEQRQLHDTMARYFSDILDPAMKAKCTRAQPLTLSSGAIEVPVWAPHATVNKRRCVEAGPHLLGAGLFGEACQELCSLESVAARSEAHEVFALLQQLCQLSAHVSELTTAQAERIDHYLRWLRRCVHSLADDPAVNVLATSRIEPEVSVVRQDLLALRASAVCDRPPVPLTSDSAWIRCTTCGNPSQTFPPLQNVLEGHTNHVNSVCFSPCGKFIASASDDNSVRVWDAITGQLLHSLEGHGRGGVPGGFVAARVRTLGGGQGTHLMVGGKVYVFNRGVYSPDSTTIVTGSDDCTVRIWDATTEEVLFTLEEHSSKVSSVGYNPTGDLIVSAGYDHKVIVWEVHTGRKALEIDVKRILSIASFSRDGATILSRTVTQTLQVWDARDGRLLSSFEGLRSGVSAVAYTMSGAQLVSGGIDSTVRVWDPVTGFQHRVLKGHDKGVSCLCTSPTDETALVSGGYDNKLTMWDIYTGTAQWTHEGHTEGILTVAFDASGTHIASGGWDGAVRVWDVAAPAMVWERLGDVGQIVTCVCFHSSQSAIVSCGGDTSLKVWSAATGDQIGSACLPMGGNKCLTFNTDGSRLLVGSRSGKIIVLDTCELGGPMGTTGTTGTAGATGPMVGEVIATLEGHSADVHCVAFSADSLKIVSASADKNVFVFDAVSRDGGSAFEAHTRWVRCVVFSKDGSKIISSSHDQTIRVFDAHSCALLQTLTGHTADIWAVDASSDGEMLVSGAWDKTVRLWLLATGAPICVLVDHTDKVNAAVFSPDGQQVASGATDCTVKVWQVKGCGEYGDDVSKHQAQVVMTLRGHKSGVSTLCYRPDGGEIVSGSWDKTIRCWNSRSGELVAVMEGCSFGIISVAISPDGETIASGAADKVVRIWDTCRGQGPEPRQGKVQRILEGHLNWVNWVTFSPDGSLIASGSSDSSVRLWDVESGKQVVQLGGRLRHLGSQSMSIRTLCFSPDGLRIVSGGYDNTVRLWDAVAGWQVS